MQLGNEITRAFSRLFSSLDSKDNNHDAYRSNCDERRVPLMHIVESKVSQRQPGKERKLAVATRIALASEVGPPPLTPAAIRR